MNNKKRGSNKNEGLIRIIQNTINRFIIENNINNSKEFNLIKFSNENTSLKPIFDKDPSFFCNPEVLTKIINKLKN